MDTSDDLDNNIENDGNNHTVNDNDNNTLSDHIYSYNSLSSAYDSRPSDRSSISSSISGWTPRARSTSVSSQGSNDSVNLDALIAEGSDINEERPLELEDGDDVEWSKDQQRQLQQQQQQQLQEQQQQNTLANVNRSGLRSRSTTGGSQADIHQYEDQDVGDYYSGSEGNSEVNSEVPTMEEDEEFDETLRGFSHFSNLSMDIPEVRGLTMAGGRRSTVTSPRFPDGRNPFDLEADYADTPAGLRSGDRMSNISNYSSAGSDRSSISRLPAAGNSRLPASGLKAPSTRLAQPGTRSMPTQPKATRSSGLQAPKAGSQVPKSGLQAPKAGSSSALVARGSSIAVPGRTAANTKIPPADQRKGVTSSRLPSNTANSTVRAGTKSQIAPPNSSRKPSVTGANRQSLLQAPSASRIATTTTGRPPSRTTNPTSPKRTLTAPNLLTSPTRSASDRHLNSAYMVSPTSSQGSSSSLTARDTVTSVSRRLSSATGTSQLTQPKTTVRGRSISMYGSGGLYTSRDIAHQQQQDYEEADYAVLTPPQSPSSKAGSRAATGIPRSGIAAPSRLIAPTVSTRTGRAVSPPQLSAGSNSSNQGSMLPRSHTPTSSLPVSRMTSGLVSPRAGRH
ncbi:hypothetical protein BGZ80_002559 [Entomortierella chlamydospora]|uniref:Uncharacterized protein n=1 Tax=Entomortierella chlamydospora TaxID=101097 RepID=A0A9P6SX20_9FUNG|nr:hypothetical protein BGZ79_009623 [Entomortierella chlamydospora]KAG0009278.1 hypothetical protein BGZ80_002559 [Entomortierella chlamydospora]